MCLEFFHSKCTQKGKNKTEKKRLSISSIFKLFTALFFSLCAAVFSHGGSSSTKPNSTTTTTTTTTTTRSTTKPKPTATATATTSGEAEPSGAAATEPGRGEDSSR